jgi:hypothetical protein
LLIAGNDTVRCFIRQSYFAVEDTTERGTEWVISLYPNPSINGIFYVELNEENLQMDVFDIYGRRIWSWQATSSIEKIDLSRQRSGVYFLRMTKNGRRQTLKLVRL